MVSLIELRSIFRRKPITVPQRFILISQLVFVKITLDFLNGCIFNFYFGTGIRKSESGWSRMRFKISKLHRILNSRSFQPFVFFVGTALAYFLYLVR